MLNQKNECSEEYYVPRVVHQFPPNRVKANSVARAARISYPFFRVIFAPCYDEQAHQVDERGAVIVASPDRESFVAFLGLSSH